MPETYSPSDPRGGAVNNEHGAYRAENLALLYQGVFTGIVRVQAGRQPIVDPNAFQRRMEELLREVEREAIKAGYQKEDIEEANYAVVAFLDEAVLTSNDPAKDRWSSWQAKRYTGAVAGEGFFEHLKVIRGRRDSAQLADLLEVYCLCLLLGYQGRYAISYASELQPLLDDMRAQIERIRGRRDFLSPDGLVPPGKPLVMRASDPLARTLQLSAIVLLASAVVCWVLFKFLLYSGANDVRQALNILGE
jgi:type VI secretion system protein ImpK